MVTPLVAGLAGSLFGGGISSIFGGGRTGFGKALEQSFDANTNALQRGVENFNSVGPGFFAAFRRQSPVFGALEQRVLSDLDDTSRTARLESAFQSRLGSQQASRGLFRSPSAALQSSFSGLQFQEQLRQQSFQNAIGFQTQLGQPLAQGFFQSGLPGVQADIGFQQLAFQTQQRQARNETLAGGLSGGFNAGIGFNRLLQDSQGSDSNSFGDTVKFLANFFNGNGG
jgi:hypothetical protein